MNQLVGPGHTYIKGVFIVNKDAPSCHFYDFFSSIIHPYQHPHTITL